MREKILKAGIRLLLVLLSGFWLLSSACAKRESFKSLVPPGEDMPLEKLPTEYRWSSASDPALNLEKVFLTKCAVCHGGNEHAAGKIMLDNYLRVFSRERQIWKAIQPGGTMSTKAGPDRDKMMNWLSGGCPE